MHSFLQQNIFQIQLILFKCYNRYYFFYWKGELGVRGSYCKYTFKKVAFKWNGSFNLPEDGLWNCSYNLPGVVFGMALITYQGVVFGLALIFPWTTCVRYLNVGGSHYSLFKKKTSRMMILSSCKQNDRICIEPHF